MDNPRRRNGTFNMAQSQEQHLPGPPPEIVRLGYDTRDARIRGLAIFLVFFVITGVVLWVIVWFVMQMFLDNERTADRPQSAIVMTLPPPPPRIQPSAGPGGHEPGAKDVLPFQDLVDMHRHEDAIFEKLGWAVDRDSHQVQIPAAILAEVQRAESKAASSKGERTEPTAGPHNANTIYPGPPTTQTTSGTALSPQGPGGNQQTPASGPVSDQGTRAVRPDLRTEKGQ
jgi:hypothetical protein